LFNSHPSFGMSIYLATANGTETYTGNGTSGAYIWGAQLEESSTYATSYIPTTSASVTRVADVASKTGLSSLIGQTEGTLYAEVSIDVKQESGTPIVNILGLNVNAANLDNCIILGINRGATNQIYAYAQVANVTQFVIFSGNISSGTHKVALAYKANDFALFVDGVLVMSAVSGSVPATSQALLGSRFNGDTFSLNDRIAQALLFKTRLTNAQLAELTTL
jgi:hypothetical protein